jgi:hypothetical protein
MEFVDKKEHRELKTKSTPVDTRSSGKP